MGGLIRERFDVTSIKGEDMFNFKNYFSTFFKKSATKNGDKFLVAKICNFLQNKYDSDDSQTMSVRCTIGHQRSKGGTCKGAFTIPFSYCTANGYK